MKLKESNKNYHTVLLTWLSPLIAVIVAGSLSGIGISFKSIPSFLLHIVFYIILFFFIKWFMQAGTRFTIAQERKIDDIKESNDELTRLYFEGVSKRAQEQRARWKAKIKKWLKRD